MKKTNIVSFLDKAHTQQQAQQQDQQMTKEQREALHNKAYQDIPMAEKEAFKDAWLNDQIPKKPLKRMRFPGDKLNL